MLMAQRWLSRKRHTGALFAHHIAISNLRFAEIGGGFHRTPSRRTAKSGAPNKKQGSRRSHQQVIKRLASVVKGANPVSVFPPQAQFMISNWLPSFCSRLNIFLSYATEHRTLAQSIAQTLKNDGHRVFFDQDSLPPAGDYNEQIRKAINSSDRFVFLASKGSLAPGRYSLTELDLAKKKWPSPVGRVFPVIIEPGFSPGHLPPYLSSVHAVSIAGNATAEIAAIVERSGRVTTVCRVCFGMSSLAVIGVGLLATGTLPLKPKFNQADLSIVAPQYVHFRPRARPPSNPAAVGADTGWAESPVTVTLPVAYSHANASSSSAQLLSEEVEIKLGPHSETYAWTYVVEISGSAISDSRCGEDWLCQKGNVKTENLKPGEITPTRETMYLSTAAEPLRWRAFMERVLAADGPGQASVVLRSRIVPADGFGNAGEKRETECTFDIAGSRRRMIDAGFSPQSKTPPPVWQPRCQTK